MSVGVIHFLIHTYPSDIYELGYRDCFGSPCEGIILLIISVTNMSVNTASDVGRPMHVPGILQENDSKKKELVGVPLPLNYPVHLRGGNTLQLNN